jgi:hypothetical protein
MQIRETEENQLERKKYKMYENLNFEFKCVCQVNIVLKDCSKMEKRGLGQENRRIRKLFKVYE